MHYAGIIGDPVEHSRSPAMHNAGFAHLGLAMRYEHWPTPAASLAERIASLRRPEMLGGNVTLPHKAAVIPLLDEIEDEARRIGAVNTIFKRADGALVGTNTDAPGFLADLRANGVDPAGCHVVVLGASGAARAAAYALVQGGASQLVIANRTLARAEELLADVLEGDWGGWGWDGEPPRFAALSLADESLLAEVAACDLLVNTTSLGWHGDETPLPNPPVRQQTLVYDMVYRPTRLLRDSAARGARTLDGMGMLLHQGLLAFTRWTGQPAPAEVMLAALKA
ncbi:MAG: shikimate dehydrogenase [Chloroflexaceae bacterium]|jgi:shikimate dehydrogenase|nr:shikimate dehydrogenase [Chloroflexaceae bacterium]